MRALSHWNWTGSRSHSGTVRWAARRCASPSTAGGACSTSRLRIRPRRVLLILGGFLTNPIQPVRGMNDVLPAEIGAWQHLEQVARGIFESYGYEEMRVPILEHTELFERSIGEFTDIVEKEMYTFQDIGGDSLTLRPEATAGIVRAAISNGLL